jgi:HK97 family phage prohead protease
VNLTYKTSKSEIKDLDTKQGIVQVYPTNFTHVDTDEDKIRPTAYNKTISEWGPSGRNRIWMLKNHDSSLWVSKPKELTPDSYGVLATVQIPQTSLGKDLILLYEEGHITEHSVGIVPIIQTYNKAENYNDIAEVKWYEFSPVAWGANEYTPTVSVKSLDDAVSQLQLTRKSLRSWKGTEDGYDLLEIKLMQLEDWMDQYVKAVEAKAAAIESTTKQQPAVDIENQLKAAEFLQISEAKFFISKLNERLSKAV